MIDGIRERGRYYDIIIEALLAYDEWMKDDDYNSTTALNKIMKRMRERLEMSDPPQPAPVAQGAQEPYAWAVERPTDSSFPRLYRTKREADAMVNFVTVNPPATSRPLYASSVPSAHRVGPYCKMADCPLIEPSWGPCEKCGATK